MGKAENTDNIINTSFSHNSTKLTNIKRNKFNTILHIYKSNAKGLINNHTVSSKDNIITTKTCARIKEKISQSLEKINR